MIGINRMSGITGILECDYHRQYFNELNPYPYPYFSELPSYPYNAGIDTQHHFTREELIEISKGIIKLIETIIDIMEKDKGALKIEKEKNRYREISRNNEI